MIVNKDIIPVLKRDVKWRAYLKGIVIEPEFALNETASYIFRLINSKNRVRDIVKKMLDEYAIEEEEALKDIINLIDRLVEEKIVELCLAS